MVENKFFFNHYSLTNENALELFSKLIEGIKYFYSQKELINNTFYFYTEVESFWEFRLNDDFTIKDLFSSLQTDYKSFFATFISQSKKIENIFDNDEILEQLPEYDITPICDGSGEQFYLLSLNADLEGILLSFNRDIWTKSLVEVSKNDTVHDEYSNIFLKNIATKEHATEIIKNEEEIIIESILEKLPNESIKYTDAFMLWLKAQELSHIEKTVEKINFAMEHKLERRLGAIGKINSKEIDNLYEVVVGSPQGEEDAQIRVFFKSFNYITYFIYGFIKRNEYGISYEKLGHISNTLEIIKDEKLDEI